MAKGAKVIWIQEPSGKYKTLGETALTDELFGGTTFWKVGSDGEGIDGSFVLDLGKETPVSSIESDFPSSVGCLDIASEESDLFHVVG